MNLSYLSLLVLIGFSLGAMEKGEISITDFDALKNIKKYKLPAPVDTAALHPGGSRVAVSGDYWRGVCLLDEKTTFFEDDGGTQACAFHPNGKLLATVQQLALKLWALDTQEKISISGKGQQFVPSLAFNQDGKLVYGICEDSVSYPPIRSRIIPREMRRGVFTYDNWVFIEDPETQQESALINPESTLIRQHGGGKLTQITCCPVDSTIALGYSSGVIELYDSRFGKTIKQLEGELSKKYLVGVDGKKNFSDEPCSVHNLSFNVGGTQLASSHRAAMSPVLWDLRMDKEMYELPVEKNYWSDDRFHYVAFHPTKPNLLAIAKQNKQLIFFDTYTNKVIEAINIKGTGIKILDFSSDGSKLLAAGGGTQKISGGCCEGPIEYKEIGAAYVLDIDSDSAQIVS